VKTKSKSIIEKIAETPAIGLARVLQAGGRALRSALAHPLARKAEAYWRVLGPGLTTGAADDDPSGIVTYSQVGAQYGYGLIWLATYTFPLMAVVQEMCARIGLATGMGLAANLRRHFPRWVLYVATLLLFCANTFNIGADLGAIASAMRLIEAKVNFAFALVATAVLSLGIQIFATYECYSKYMKWLALILLSYVASTLLIRDLPWGSVLRHAIVPSLGGSKEELLLLCGIMGTTISPYLFFWQTSQEVEEEILKGHATVAERRASVSPERVSTMRIDVWSGMLLSNMVMFFIIAACAATLHQDGAPSVVTLGEAAVALRPLAGNAAVLLFALGVVGTGFLSIPVLAGSASYAVAETLGWRTGLHRTLLGAAPFYGVMILSVAIGLALNAISLDPFKALIYAAVLNGLIAPVLVVLIVLLSSSPAVMGPLVSGSRTQATGWLVSALMAASGVAAIISLS
jgi:NRAMP (natural resistance-associated macrophage protein)-like metal ion transporter